VVSLKLKKPKPLKDFDYSMVNLKQRWQLHTLGQKKMD